jgi:hypothetical protein
MGLAYAGYEANLVTSEHRFHELHGALNDRGIHECHHLMKFFTRYHHKRVESKIPHPGPPPVIKVKYSLNMLNEHPSSSHCPGGMQNNFNFHH